MGILDFYKYPEIYPEHRELLLSIEKNIENFDVFLIIASTGAGKTALKQTIARWWQSVVLLAPTNNLLSQELVDYPDTPYIQKKSLYKSEEEYLKSVEWTTNPSVPILCVPHSIVAHSIKRDVLLYDEGHKLLELNREMQSHKLLKQDFLYEDTFSSREDFLNMLAFEIKSPSKPQNKAKAKRILRGIDECTGGFQDARASSFMLKRDFQMHRGKRKDMVKVIPLNPPLHFLFKRFRKLILMSATLSLEDVKSLRLSDTKKAVILEIPSRIPVESRPLVKSYIGSFNHSNLPSYLPQIAQRILDISDFHNNCKGLVHVTYELMSLLRPYLSDNPRFLFNDKPGTSLATWLSETSNRVLLAAGVGEGLDLKGESFGFQIISKILWSNLGDPGIKKRMELSPNSYNWETLRGVMQSYGRICRGERDYGVTYVLDSSYDRLYSASLKAGLVPDWFRGVN